MAEEWEAGEGEGVTETGCVEGQMLSSGQKSTGYNTLRQHNVNINENDDCNSIHDYYTQPHKINRKKMFGADDSHNYHNNNNNNNSNNNKHSNNNNQMFLSSNSLIPLHNHKPNQNLIHPNHIFNNNLSHNNNNNNNRIQLHYPQSIVICKIKVVFAIDWSFYESFYKPKRKMACYEVTQYSTLEDLKRWILDMTKRITFGNAPFYRPELDDMDFCSKQCIFHSITWQKNGGLDENVPILSIYDASDIPSLLPLNDYRSKHRKNSYKIRYKIGENCHYDYTQRLKINKCDLIKEYFNGAMNNNNGNNSNNSNNSDNNNNNNNNSNNNNNNNSANKPLITEMKEMENENESKHYDCDKLPLAYFSEIDIGYAKAWEKYQLHNKSDPELYQILLHLYESILIEKRRNSTEIDKFAKIKQEITDVDSRAKKKLGHNVHTRMGCPLKLSNILALVLYTNDYCCEALKNKQIPSRNDDNKVDPNTFDEKFIVFDYCLFWAVTKLNEFQKVDKENIMKYQVYSGSYGREFDRKRFAKNENMEFITYTSFTCDPNVAIRFCSGNDTSMMLVLNDTLHIVSCDVSWISPYGRENEILIRRHCGTKVKHIEYSHDKKKQIVLLGNDACLTID